MQFIIIVNSSELKMYIDKLSLLLGIVMHGVLILSISKRF